MIRSRRTKVGLVAGCAIVTSCLVSGIAFAQAAGAPPAGGGASAAGGVKNTPGAPAGKAEGYGYEFTDDPLNAGGFGPNDATIRVRPGPVRTTLIRPRTSFVPEMLKSVENL